MAKRNTSYKFSKATLTKDDNGRYIIEEIIKEESKFYDLTEILNALDGSSDLSISITSEDVVEPMDEG